MLRMSTRKRKPASCACMLPTQGPGPDPRFLTRLKSDQLFKTYIWAYLGQTLHVPRDQHLLYAGSSAPVIATCTTGSGSPGVPPTAITADNWQLGINTICTASTTTVTQNAIGHFQKLVWTSCWFMNWFTVFKYRSSARLIRWNQYTIFSWTPFYKHWRSRLKMPTSQRNKRKREADDKREAKSCKRLLDFFSGQPG